MALFKILKGEKALPTDKHDGWAYVQKTHDDAADFYVDYDDSTRVKVGKYSENGIYFVNNSSTSAGVWYGANSGILNYYNGLAILYQVPTHGGGTISTTLDINTLDAKKCFIEKNVELTTHYPAGTLLIMIYDETLDGAMGGWLVHNTAKLTYGCTLKVNLDSTNASTAFDGSADVHDIGVAGSLGIENGGTDATSEKDARVNLLSLGSNPITSITNDTVSNWGDYGPGAFAFYSQAGQLIDQPSQWGFIFNIAVNRSSEIHQIWTTQASGDMYHRGGNSSGWSGTWRKILDSSNYTDYTVKKDGTGASGTWDINISGGAGQAQLLALHNYVTNTSTRSTSASGWDGSVTGLSYVWGQSWFDSSISGDSGDLVLGLRPSVYSSGATELCMMIDGDYYSLGNKVLHAGNYTDYTVTKTGGGASGTWGISISGNAATATALTSDAGSSTVPVYFSGGKPVAVGSIWTNSSTSSTSEFQVGVRSAAGTLYMYSQGSATGNRGLYCQNNAGTYKSVLTIDSSNNVTLNGTANYATSAGSATTDGNGNTITSKYVTIDTAQTISGAKTFSASPTVYGSLYPSINFTNSTNNRKSVFEGSYTGSAILWSYNATSGDANRRGIAVNAQDYQSDVRNALWLRTCENNTWKQYQVITSVGGQTIAGSVNSSGVLGGNWIGGTHQASFVVTSATTASAGNYYQGWYSGKTQSGAWSLGALSGSEDLYFAYGTDSNYNANSNVVATIRFGAGGQVYGAVWNDYAEYRNQFENISAGRVAYCKNDGKLRITTERLQRFEGVVSDTFGFAIGETDNAKTPLAVSGRVLVYTYESRDTFNSGDCVCAAPNGTVSKMSREEIVAYPDRIVGIVSEIPEYETWGTGDVPVNGRIWIKVK